MSALRDMQPNFDAYQAAIRKAKNASGYTNQELSDLSGVPYNNVCTISAGTAKQPSLFYSAALCKVLGLSLDSLMDLPSRGDPAHVRELELEKARLETDVKHYERRANTYRPLIVCLASICALLLCSVIGYMIFDLQIKNAGLFQQSGIAATAVFLAAIVIAAVVLIVHALRTVIRRGE